MNAIPWQADAVATLKRLVLHTFLWGSFFLGLLFAVPIAEHFYRDFNFKLPAMTVQVLDLSRGLAGLGPLLPLAFLFLLTVDGAVYFLLRRGQRTRVWSTVWSGFVIALSQVALWWLVVGAWLPLMSYDKGLAR